MSIKTLSNEYGIQMIQTRARQFLCFTVITILGMVQAGTSVMLCNWEETKKCLNPHADLAAEKCFEMNTKIQLWLLVCDCIRVIDKRNLFLLFYNVIHKIHEVLTWRPKL